MREDDPRLPGGGDEPPDPNGPATDPWSPSDLTAATAFYTDYIKQHGLGSWGTPDDALNAYRQLRQQGQAHDAALQGALHTLGWDDPAKWPAPSTPPPATPPAGGGAGGPPALPPFTPPTNTPLPGAPTFTSPSVEDALKDPGYQFREQQGERSLQNWAAAKGTLNDSGTAKALIDYGQSAAQQGYADVWNRDFSVFQGNTGIWNTKVAATEHDNDTNYMNAWNRWLNQQDLYKWWATAGA